MDELREYPTVRNWLADRPGRGFQPVREDPERKLALLASFCAHIDVDPDTLIATCTDLLPTGQATRNAHLKSLKTWVAAMNLSEAEATRTENVIRGFFIKNAIKVMTRPYADVYRRAPAPRSRSGSE
jgi:hypothetical protein